MTPERARTLVIGFEGLSASEASALVPGVAPEQWVSLPVDDGQRGRDAFWWTVATGDSRRAMPAALDGRVSHRPIWSVLDRMGGKSACVAWPRTFTTKIHDACVVSDVACRVEGPTYDAWLCPPTVAWPTDVWDRFRDLRVHSEDITLDQVRELAPSLKADVPLDAPIVRALRTALASASTVQAAALDLVEHRAPETLFLFHGMADGWPRSGPLGAVRPRALGFLRGCVGFVRQALNAEHVVVITRDALLVSPSGAADVGRLRAVAPLNPADVGATLFDLLRVPTATDRDGRPATGAKPVVWTHDGVELAGCAKGDSP